MKDIFGKALLDFHNNEYSEDIITWTSISDKDVLPIPYLFRTFDDMPLIEQTALQLSYGSVLDVGCGSGSHALWLQHEKLKVKAIDSSPGAIEVCKQRGVNHAIVKSLLDENGKFDTILILMNGTGIFESISKTPMYLKHLKSLLKPDGQILVDSSDIAYMYDHVVSIDYDNYYGELDYFLSYKGEEALPSSWLYLDYETLQKLCKAVNLTCETISYGDHFDYLAKLSIG